MFLLIFKDILQIAFCQELLFQIMIALRLLTIVFSVFFSCKDILKRAVGHTPKSKTLDEVYLHPKANQIIEAFDSANQLVKDEVLALPEE